jgi:hypothetical protein
MTNATDNREEYEIEVLRTREALETIEAEVRHFKELVGKLEEECREKERVIE